MEGGAGLVNVAHPGVVDGSAIASPSGRQPRRPLHQPPPPAAAAGSFFGNIEMSVEWKARLRAFVDVAIRVPPLFVMDSLLARWNVSPDDAANSGKDSSSSAEMVEQAALEAGINAMLWFLVYATCE